MKRKRRIKKYRSLADVRFVKVLFVLAERLKEEEEYLRHLLCNTNETKEESEQ